MFFVNSVNIMEIENVLTSSKLQENGDVDR
jgi:hypothetical protein